MREIKGSIEPMWVMEEEKEQEGEWRECKTERKCNVTRKRAGGRGIKNCFSKDIGNVEGETSDKEKARGEQGVGGALGEGGTRQSGRK